MKVKTPFLLLLLLLALPLQFVQSVADNQIGNVEDVKSDSDDPYLVELFDSVSAEVELEPYSSQAFSFTIDDDKGSLEINFESTHILKVDAYLVNKKSLEQKEKTIELPSGKKYWTVTVDSDLMKLFDNGKLLIEVSNLEMEEAKMEIHIEYKSSPVLIYVLISVGVAIFLVNTVLGCCYLIKRKKLDQQTRAAASVTENQERNVVENNPSPINSHRNMSERALVSSVPEIYTYFPEAKFEELKSPFLQRVCSICLEEFKASSVCRQLTCHHIFHSECIRIWLENQFAKGHVK